jgi:hypothetical protein
MGFLTDFLIGFDKGSDGMLSGCCLSVIIKAVIVIAAIIFLLYLIF